MLRRCENPFGGSLFDQFPGIHDRDAVGDGSGVQVVGDQHQGRALSLYRSATVTAAVAVAQQTREDVEDAAPGDRVEARGDLVADQDAGVGEEGAGQGRPLEFAAGEPGGAASGQFRGRPRRSRVDSASVSAAAASTPRSRTAVRAI